MAKKFKISYDLDSFIKAFRGAKSLNKEFKTDGFKVKRGEIEKGEDGITAKFRKGYDKDPN